MATVEQVAADHYRQRAALGRRIAEETAALWRALDPSKLRGSWSQAAGRVFALVAGAQALAATGADPYLAAVLAAQGLDSATEGQVNARSLAGVASDGRDLASLLDQPLITTLTAIGQGATVARAMTVGLLHMDTIVRTQIADAGRVADGVATTSRRTVHGYVRMLNPPSCSRCAILAGRWYRWSSGFDRHPRCDCVHIPSNEDHAGDLRTDPHAYFRGLTKSEQDRLFTKSGAEAIRDGADMSRVVNARRGMYTAGESRTRINDQGFVVNERRRTLATNRIGGRDVFATTEARRSVGLRARLMPEQIYLEAAGSRDEALRLLRLHGYIF